MCRWGTYLRKVPIVCWVARFYCPTDGVTFGLVPDCLATRMPGTLEQVEQAAEAVEGPGRAEVSLEQQGARLRSEQDQAQAIEPRSAVEWMKRRHRAVVRVLAAAVEVLAPVFAGCSASLEAFATRMGVGQGGVLRELRVRAGKLLAELPSPVGGCCRPELGGANNGCGS